MPEYTHNIVHDFLNGNIKSSMEAQIKVIPLIKALFCEVNPIPVKSALNMIGFNVGTPRLPLIEMSEKGKEKLSNELKNLNLI